MNEVDLARHVIKWLEEQHWDVYQEVQFRYMSGIADIVAVRASIIWIIETKTALSLAVLEQAHNWRSHLRSIAVPACVSDSHGRGVAYGIAKDYLKIGVIEVGRRNEFVKEVVEPPIMRQYHEFASDMRKQLKPIQKTYRAAGSNGGGYWTPYRETMDAVRRFVSSHPNCTLKQIMDDIKGEHHYASSATARSSIRVALSNWESDWCVVHNDGKEFTYSLKDGLRR